VDVGRKINLVGGTDRKGAADGGGGINGVGGTEEDVGTSRVAATDDVGGIRNAEGLDGGGGRDSHSAASPTAAPVAVITAPANAAAADMALDAAPALAADADDAIDGDTAAFTLAATAPNVASCDCTSTRVPHPALAPGLPLSVHRRPPAAPTADCLPSRDDVLMEFCKTEILVAAGMTARMGTTPAETGACVHGAQVLVVIEAFDPIVTWSSYSNSCMLAFCSC